MDLSEIVDLARILKENGDKILDASSKLSLSTSLLRLKNLRSQIEYLICIRSAKNLKDILEYCGGDKVQGFLWNELKEAVFCHNSIDNLDTSLEFLPQLSSIDLSHNCIQNVHYINCLSNLRYLNLNFNKIECIPVFNRQLCDTLQVLLLRNNYIDDIKELAALINLCELDLSNNCLIEHNQLISLSHLENLQRLMLMGNPLSYHPKHRRKTVMYMHIKSPKDFLLDNTYLNTLELRAIGTINPVLNGFDRSSSMNSVTSINTVVPVCNRTAQNFTAESTSDMEVSDGSSLSNNQSDVLNENSWSSSHARDSEGFIMQDSGFVAEPRRLSSSICSIDDKEETPSGTKRQRRNSIDTCLLHKIAENSPNIEELELWSCLRVDGCYRISNESCNAIAEFKYLRKLTLDNLPIHINGSFLSNVGNVTDKQFAMNNQRLKPVAMVKCHTDINIHQYRYFLSEVFSNFSVMVFTTAHKTYMIEAYFRTGVQVNGIWQYSQRVCLDNFREHFPDLAVLEQDFYMCLAHSVGVFRETGSVTHKKGAGRPSIRTEELIIDVRNRIEQDPTKSLRHLSQEIGVSYETCRTVLTFM
ncbi:nischarin related [Holotrichia oblita]|uniref:Nischarin related n=1 Tax=Holotrichia oblita TaxID=644536 RepID=A0ACB9SYD2_HOLOL|nr:nischarin related [Holotrichia oblita]